MAIVNGSLELGYKNLAWFNANPTLVLKEGQIVYLQQTGTYKIGNGTSTLSALSFLGISSETQTLQNVTDLGATTTNSITANGFVKSGGTASQFLKANGSVDSTTYLSTQVVPVGGTTGQILAKVDDTDYNLEWIENYANYTSTLKHTVKASVALTKGQAVYVSGASGTNMLVSKASNVSEATSSKTLGLIAQNLAINGNGFVITEGLLSGLNTNSATIGDAVWLGVDGALIYGLVNKPYAPAHLVFIGIVTRVSATVGEIFVKVQNGFELNEIHDVDLITTTPSNNEILTYESSTGLWKNKSVISALGFTPYNSTNPSNYISGITSGMVTTALGFTPYNSTNPSGYITGITSGMVTTALGFTPYNATNPDGYITSSALTSYVPYTGATANVDLGTRTLTTPTINGVSGLLSFGSTDRVSVGNYATPSAQRIFTVGQDTAFITMGSLVGSTTYSAIYFNRATPSINNFALMGDVNSTRLGTTNQINFERSGTTFMQTEFGMRVTWNMTSNAFGYTPFNYIKNAVTGATASTPLLGWNYLGGSTQWLTGNITTQSEIVWGAVTYSFVGASTITNAYGNVFNAPIAGINATITNNWAALFNGSVNISSSLNVGNYATPSAQRAFTVGQDTSYTSIGSMIGATGSSAIYMNVATPSVVNYVLRSSGTNVFLNSPSASDSLILSTGGVANRFVITGTFGGASFNAFALLGASNTGQTASTAVAGWNYQSFSRQWATGNIATQSENVWGATTYSFVAASTITNAYGNVFNAPIAGANATITNNFAARFNGQLYLTQTVTTETVVQTKTVTIVINGTTYKLLAA